jgi:thiol-disulfide isomerase/thioredoxin
MRFLTTPLLGFLLLLLASCNNDPTSTVSNEQAGDAQQHSHEDAHGGAPPQHAPDGHADPPQDADHELIELASGPANPISIGDKVPNFEVTIDDKKWTLSQLRRNTKLTNDGTIVLTFWCSFCHSCRDVDQSLNQLAEHYKGKAAVIALDASDGETTEQVAQFAKKKGLTLPIALNASGSAADIFGTKVTTTTVVIDKEGVLRYRGQFGSAGHPFTRDALESVLHGQTVKVTETKHRG